MGTWNVSTFGNDIAMDWSYELKNSEDLSPIIAALSAISEKDYLEEPDCSTALAAAEVIAALNGNPGKDLPDEVSAWVSSWLSSNKLSADNELAMNAKKAVTRIKLSSELKDLWMESESIVEWRNTINDLLLRLPYDESDDHPLSFSEWTRKKWYIFALLAGICSALAQLFISKFSVTIGLVAAYGISYFIYSMQDSE